MEIESKGGTEFLVLNIENETRLNPFSINITEIRYIREYMDRDGQPDGLAIFVGNKMFHTRDDIKGFCGIVFDNGTTVMIGNSEYYCVKGSGLTDRQRYFYLINTKKILYIRKFIQNGDKSEESNKFAVITVDERIIQIDAL